MLRQLTRNAVLKAGASEARGREENRVGGHTGSTGFPAKRQQVTAVHRLVLREKSRENFEKKRTREKLG